MVIVNTKLSHTFFGAKKVVFGKSVISGGVATGDVDLATMGLKRVTHFKGTVKAAAASSCSCTETFPCIVDITIITSAINQTVYWMAIGLPG
jgi:hypothetical protein